MRHPHSANDVHEVVCEVGQWFLQLQNGYLPVHCCLENAEIRVKNFEAGLLLLPGSKTGKKKIKLNASALAVLAGLCHVGTYVSPASRYRN